MISFILLSIVFLFVFSNNFKEIENNNEILISNYITSLTCSISLIGSISMGLIFIKSVHFPIILISILIFLSYFLFSNLSSINIKNFSFSCKNFLNIFLKNNSNKFIFFLLIFLYLLSFGPINHPDATTTYVGYPFQFFLQGKHFIDGGLHQGVLGIADFANLVFFQEKSVWLIRMVQAIPLLMVVSIFLTRGINKLIIISLLTTPVFIQWLTIGKFIFFPDLAITLTYLVWDRYRNKNNLLNLFIIIVLSISFKITCLIITIPILFHIFFYLSSKKQLKLLLKIDDKIRYFFLFSAVLVLLEILFYRFYITGNFLYPLFNNYFLPDNQQMIDFEITLKKYIRDDGLPFITKNINYLGYILGPSNSFLLIGLPILSFFSLKQNQTNKYNIIGISQIFLLLTISNGRADYFASPLILILINNNKFKLKDYFINKFSKFKFNYFKNVFLSTLWLQILIFFGVTFMSIYQTFFGIWNYESSMNRFAYNYELSSTLNKFAPEPIINFYDRTPLLFFKKDYIHEDKFKKCIRNGEEKNFKNPVESCFQQFRAKSIITNSGALKNINNFNCKKYSTNYTSRNPFRFMKREFDLCIINNKY